MSGWEIFLGIALGLIVNEACELSPWAARRLVQWSARVRYPNPERAETRAAELVSLIEERPGKLFKLCTALGFFAQAIIALTRQTKAKNIPLAIIAITLKRFPFILMVLPKRLEKRTIDRVITHVITTSLERFPIEEASKEYFAYRKIFIKYSKLREIR
ncbi:hypothetical protein [Streptosporangium jomthongense]|uniref:Uncharacterized protein n=1 Tax=Streptosporangium jomthongense TaxID=1193683 RepID=A0ABV8EV25_9ACTN